MDDPDPLGAEEPREARRAEGVGRPAEEPVMGEAGRARLGGPAGARAGDHDHPVPAGREATGEIAQLDGGAGVEVALRVDLEDPQRLEGSGSVVGR
jgi:hypothetical protein